MTSYHYKTHLDKIPEYLTGPQVRAYLTAICLRRWHASNVMEDYLTGKVPFERIGEVIDHLMQASPEDRLSAEELCATLGMSLDDYKLYTIDPAKFKADYAYAGEYELGSKISVSRSR